MIFFLLSYQTNAAGTGEKHNPHAPTKKQSFFKLAVKY